MQARNKCILKKREIQTEDGRGIDMIISLLYEHSLPCEIEA